MIKELYIYHHMGLGDHLICNAIVRDYSKKYDKIYLFCKHRNKNTIEFMYRDLKNIYLMLVEDDSQVKNYVFQNKVNLLKIGFENLDMRLNFDESFYNQIKLNFGKKWSDFFLMRDLDSEKKLFNFFNLKEKEYIFVHDDSSRGFIIQEKFLSKDIKIIRPDKSLNFNFFDYIYTIENAKQIHCIDSSYSNLIDLLGINNELFLYKNTRWDEFLPKFKSNWKLIDNK